jgi:catalase
VRPAKPWLAQLTGAASSVTAAAAYEAHRDDDDFTQPGALYRQVMTDTDRDHLAGNIVWHLSQGVERFIQDRAVRHYWAKVDPDLGTRIAHDLGLLAPAR